MTDFHPRRFEPYKILEEHKISTFSVLNWHFQEILKSVNRKITLKQSFRHPFTVVLSATIFKELYYQGYRAVRDYPVQFGTETSTLTNKKGVLKSYEIKFTKIQSLRFHLKQLSGLEDVDVYLKKKFPHEEKGNVIVSEEDPVVLFFKLSTNTLTITMKFQVMNQHGTICNF